MTRIEEQILARIREKFPGGAFLNDDCGAIPLPPPGQKLLVTTDLLESGQHFSLEWHPPGLLSRKLLTVNLSDLDASGASPLGFTLTLAIGAEIRFSWLDEFLAGLAQAAGERKIPVLGGDTIGREQGLGLGITAFGAAERWLTRDGLRVGDHLFVDQMPGGSLRGLRKLQAGQRWDNANPDPDLAAHLDPQPNLGLGRRLAQIDEVHACIDLSDGLSKDLRMLAEASSLSIIVNPALDQEVMEGGEDYARCFACSLPQAELEALLGMPLILVGEVTEHRDVSVLHYDGMRLLPLPDLSFNHFHRAE